MTRMRVVLCAGAGLDCRLPLDADHYIGVDAGSLDILDLGLSLELAVGDFDSVNRVDIERIQLEAKTVVSLPSEKNDTDLEFALKETFRRWPEAEVAVYGALGGRLDHTLSAVFLASEPELAPFMRQIQLFSRDNQLAFYPAGVHVVPRYPAWSYIGFMPADQTRLGIDGAKYPLNEQNFFFKKCYGSNEFIDDTIQIELDQGYVVVIYSKDRR